MDAIKTYADVGANNSFHEFRWADMEAVYQERKGQTDAPHRHHYYTVLIIRRGQGQHWVDFTPHPLGERQVYFITPGQVHQLRETAPTEGMALVFSDAFLTQTHTSPSFLSDLQLFRTTPNYAPLDLDAGPFEQIWADAQRMGEHYHRSQKYRMNAIGALLELVLLECYEQCSLPLEHPQHLEGGHGLVRAFQQLLEEQYATWHQVAEYAQALNVTPDHLNRTLKSLLDKTAKRSIQDRLIIAAKRLLYFSDYSSKEIGYELGFSEPANFSAFFKRNTQQSPTQFRQAFSI